MDPDQDPLDRLVAGKREFGEFGGVNASVEISTTFTVLEADTLPAIFNGEVGPEKGGCYVYGRAFNPTVRHLGRQLAALEGCEAAYPCSSGMAAISSTLLALCNSGDHIVASNTIYGGSHALLKTFLPVKAGISTTFVDITDLAAVRQALGQHPGRVKVVYTEVVSNPTLRVADLRSLADLAHAAGAQLVVDNTFTPFVVTPKRFGADVVIHSLTKFISGASDIIAGAICGSAAFIRSLMDFHAGPCMLLGPTMDPRVASELSLRLPHLALRMKEHGRRAAAFAARLHSLGASVTYPGLASHPQHALMVGQANEDYGYGGLLGLDLGTPARANAFMERLQNRHGFGFMAVSLGYFDTLMSLSAASTSSELSDNDLAASGIGRGYVRMSVGITGSLEERWRQLEEAYRFTMQLGAAGAAPYRAVKVRRNPSSGALEQLISWPSLGSFGTLSDSAGAGAAVAAVTDAANAVAAEAGVAVGVTGGAAFDTAAEAGTPTPAEAAAAAAGAHKGLADDDATLALEAAVHCELLRRHADAAAAAAAAAAEAPGVAGVVIDAHAAASGDDEGDDEADAVSPVLGGTAPAAISSPFCTNGLQAPAAGASQVGASRPEPAGSASGSEDRSSGSGQGAAAGAAAESESRGDRPPAAAAGAGPSLQDPESWRPVKIRRTGSGEIHYLAVK